MTIYVNVSLISIQMYDTYYQKANKFLIFLNNFINQYISDYYNNWI